MYVPKFDRVQAVCTSFPLVMKLFCGVVVGFSLWRPRILAPVRTRWCSVDGGVSVWDGVLHCAVFRDHGVVHCAVFRDRFVLRPSQFILHDDSLIRRFGSCEFDSSS